LPFLDLFYLIFKLVILKVGKKDIFGGKIDKNWFSDTRFIVYGAFNCIEDFVGYDFIETLNRICL
jgi:hypothetical protein